MMKNAVMKILDKDASASKRFLRTAYKSIRNPITRPAAKPSMLIEPFDEKKMSNGTDIDAIKRPPTLESFSNAIPIAFNMNVPHKKLIRKINSIGILASMKKISEILTRNRDNVIPKTIERISNTFLFQTYIFIYLLPPIHQVPLLPLPLLPFMFIPS